MEIQKLALAALFSMAPISELRGAIPYAVISGMDLLSAALWCTAWNAAVPLVVYAFLDTVHKLLYRLGWYKGFFDRSVERARAKIHPEVEKYGMLGILIFVAIPLPMTGAWTGILGAWILGLDRKKSILAVIGGVMVAGAIITAVVGILGAGANSIFIKSL